MIHQKRYWLLRELIVIHQDEQLLNQLDVLKQYLLYELNLMNIEFSNQEDKFIDCNRDEISILGTYKNMLRDEMRDKLVLSKIYGFIQSHQNLNKLACF